MIYPPKSYPFTLYVQASYYLSSYVPKEEVVGQFLYRPISLRCPRRMIPSTIRQSKVVCWKIHHLVNDVFPGFPIASRLMKPEANVNPGLVNPRLFKWLSVSDYHYPEGTS